MPACLWPWWSPAARYQVQQLLTEGDMAATGAAHPHIDACEQLARDTLTAGQPVMLCDSGTAALETAYAALGLEPGSEVLVASASFRATVTAMLPQGLIPVLCDIDPATGNLDLADADARLTPRTAAVAVTHLWGRPAPLGDLRRFCDRHGLALLADCSHAHGLTWHGRPAGALADVAVWSCGTWKMATGGKAGLLTARDGRVYERACVLTQPKHRALARVRDERLRALAVTGAGHNRRPAAVSAVLVADHLRHLPETLNIKNTRQEQVEKLLARHLPALTPVAEPDGRTAGALYKWHWRLTLADRPVDDVIQALRACGVRAQHPARPLHETPLFARPGLAAALRLPRPPRLDPTGFPGTTRFLSHLVELDTRDMYRPLPSGSTDPYDHALAAAVDRLSATHLTV